MLTIQSSIATFHCLCTQRAVAFQTPGVFLTHPVDITYIICSGVARSLLLGGQGASVASRRGGPGACPLKIFGDHALETLGK